MDPLNHPAQSYMTSTYAQSSRHVHNLDLHPSSNPERVYSADIDTPHVPQIHGAVRGYSANVPAFAPQDEYGPPPMLSGSTRYSQPATHTQQRSCTMHPHDRSVNPYLYPSDYATPTPHPTHSAQEQPSSDMYHPEPQRYPDPSPPYPPTLDTPIPPAPPVDQHLLAESSSAPEYRHSSMRGGYHPPRPQSAQHLTHASSFYNTQGYHQSGGYPSTRRGSLIAETVHTPRRYSHSLAYESADGSSMATSNESHSHAHPSNTMTSTGQYHTHARSSIPMSNAAQHHHHHQQNYVPVHHQHQQQQQHHQQQQQQSHLQHHQQQQQPHHPSSSSASAYYHGGSDSRGSSRQPDDDDPYSLSQSQSRHPHLHSANPTYQQHQQQQHHLQPPQLFRTRSSTTDSSSATSTTVGGAPVYTGGFGSVGAAASGRPLLARDSPSAVSDEDPELELESSTVGSASEFGFGQVGELGRGHQGQGQGSGYEYDAGQGQAHADGERSGARRRGESGERGRGRDGGLGPGGGHRGGLARSEDGSEGISGRSTGGASASGGTSGADEQHLSHRPPRQLLPSTGTGAGTGGEKRKVGALDGAVRQGQGGAGAPVKKKKKSKMHECEICGKKFPRPSGLKTHMNTHSNEKPFPCGFPGCTRTFGVRSNAKRHLRTHGVLASSLQEATSTPYVVGFSPPMIMPAPPLSQAAADSQTDVDPSSVNGLDGGAGGMALPAGGAGAHGMSGRMGMVPGPRHAAFKLRWMPPSLTSRTNAAALREVVEQGGQLPHEPYRGPKRIKTVKTGQGQGRKGAENGKKALGKPRPGQGASASGSGSGTVEAEEDMGMDIDVDGDGVRADGKLAEMEEEDEDDEEDDEEYRSAVIRLTIPLPPVVPTLSSSMPTSGSNPTSLSTSTSLVPTPASEYPSSSSMSSMSGSGTFTSISPSSTATSFSTPPLSASSTSSPYIAHGLGRMSKLSSGSLGVGIGSLGVVGTINLDLGLEEERNSFAPVGSHPYHPSQFCGLPGPAVVAMASVVANVVPTAAPRPYLVV